MQIKLHTYQKISQLNICKYKIFKFKKFLYNSKGY